VISGIERRDKDLEPSRICEKFIEEIIKKDTKYVVEENGRPRQGKYHKPNSGYHSRKSHVCWHGILQECTESRLIDELFKDSEARIQELEALEQERGGSSLWSQVHAVRALIEVHNKYHPDKQIIWGKEKLR